LLYMRRISSPSISKENAPAGNFLTIENILSGNAVSDACRLGRVNYWRTIARQAGYHNVYLTTLIRLFVPSQAHGTGRAGIVFLGSTAYSSVCGASACLTASPSCAAVYGFAMNPAKPFPVNRLCASESL
jgi:hypothetical protein